MSFPRARKAESNSGMPNAENGPGYNKFSKHLNSSAPKNFMYFVIAALIVTGPLMYLWYQHVLRSAVTTPLNAPRTIASDASSAGKSPGRFWGSYRPGVYFGMKTRSPGSPVAGLMWFQQPVSRGHGNPGSKLRHTCEQGDGLQQYGWVEHDGINFGIQDIFDGPLHVKTAFAKQAGGSHGGDWSAAISAQYKKGVNDTNSKMLSLVFYFALDGEGSIEPVMANGQLQGIRGHTEDLGRFILKFPPKSTVKMQNHLVSYIPGLHTIRELVMQRLRYHPYKRNTQILGLVGDDPQTIEASPRKKANIVVYQVSVIPPYVMEVVFQSGSNRKRSEELSGERLTKLIQSYSDAFNQNFEKRFGLAAKGYTTPQVAFAKATMSNLIGGIGYFYGQSIVKSKYNSQPVAYWEAPLYTAVPSRSFFPRGFLWDEGFHNLLISKWDPAISVDIIGHWLDLMNSDGWIPREQILDAEARSKVPSEFVVQHDTNANPPTFFLPLQSILRDESSNIAHGQFKAFLKHVYPRLAKWYSWFNTTQQGPVPTSYRWRGRDAMTNRELNPKTLTSGFDDYPRSSHPSDEERHIDLRCWMALASGVMMEIGKTIEAPFSEYERSLQLLTDNSMLEKLHWSPKAKMFSDFGNHSTRVALERPPPPLLQPGQHPSSLPKMEKERVIKSKVGPSNKYVNSFGYVSIFPFLLQILDPNSDKLNKTLTDMKNPDMLWTKYGLRSLSKMDPLYMKYNTEHDPPYWRGAIWINVNYLAVRALHHYANTPGPYSDEAWQMYHELRKNIVANVIKQYQSSGYIWENYNDISGKGQGSHPFTGWSSLVVLMMSETY